MNARAAATLIALTGAALAMFPLAAKACWEEAERIYGVPANLLYAVASAESDLRSDAVNLSHLQRTRTYDTGLMQINSSHLRRLASFGISERDLYEPCTNIKVGAWLLADAMARHGANWNAVGAYNAACTQLRGEACTEARWRYAWRVYRRLPDVQQVSAKAPGRGPSAPAKRVAEATTAPTVYILSARVSP